jgi:hypothetical protein
MTARRTRRIAAILGVALALAGATGCRKDEVALVRGGVAVAKIVVPRAGTDADPCASVHRDYVQVCRAAVEIQTVVKEMTGAAVALPIEDDDAASPVAAELEIHLGDTRCAAQVAGQLPYASLTDEEASFTKLLETAAGTGCTAGRKFFVSGPRFASIVFYRNHGWGTRYGVSAWIERELGVHWYFPGPLGKVSPTGLADVVMAGASTISSPAYVSRELSGLADVDGEWATRNRLHYSQHLRWQFYHNVNLLLSAQVGSDVWRYYPDLWTYPTLPNGQPDPSQAPVIQAAGVTPPANPFWEPRLDVDRYDTYDKVAQRLHWYLQNDSYEAYTVGIMDNREWHAPYDQPKHEYLFTEAERDVYGIPAAAVNRNVWRFLVRTTERLLELGDHDHQWIGTLAYSNATSPPDDSVTLPQQLIVLVGGDRETTWLDASAGGPRAIDREYMTAWARKIAPGGRIAIGEKYWGAELFVPRYAPGTIAASLRWAYSDLPAAADRAGERLVTGFRAEAYPIWPLDGLKFHRAARVLWDADHGDDADPMPVAYRNLFGDAAAAMTAYFDLLEATWTDFPTSHPELYAHHTSRAQRLDRGSYFEWVDYPANIINYRDEPGLLALYRPAMSGLLSNLDAAKAVFDGRDPKPTAYYRVLLFERGARLLAAMVDFQEAEAAVEAMPVPANEAQAEAVYDAMTAIDGLWTGIDEAYSRMCHPSADQLPAGIADDHVGVPRWGEGVYRAHYKDCLPTYDLDARVLAAIAWFAGHGRAADAAALQAIHDRIWDWRDHVAAALP